MYSFTPYIPPQVTALGRMAPAQGTHAYTATPITRMETIPATNSIPTAAMTPAQLAATQGRLGMFPSNPAPQGLATPGWGAPPGAQPSGAGVNAVQAAQQQNGMTPQQAALANYLARLRGPALPGTPQPAVQARPALDMNPPSQVRALGDFLGRGGMAMNA